MLTTQERRCLKFIYVTDAHIGAGPLRVQVEAVLGAGATMIRYSNPDFSWRQYPEVMAIRNTCRCNFLPFLVQDDILLAKVLEADGVHLHRKQENPDEIRSLLGPAAIIGISSGPAQEMTNIGQNYDYVEVGPLFESQAGNGDVSVSEHLRHLVVQTRLPLVATGGIKPDSAVKCFANGAAGVAVRRFISRNESPQLAAQQMAVACGCPTRQEMGSPWHDEFDLIRRILEKAAAGHSAGQPALRVPPGDDACLLYALSTPVISTDAQREGIHFRFDWQTPLEVGQKAVSVALSDLAACFARPVSLFVNLTLAPYVSDRVVEQLYTGIGHSLRRYGCALGGGNVSAGGHLGLDLFAVGEGRPDLFPKRSGARPGDGLYCTGPLGLARAGLDLLVRKDPDFPLLIERFKFPRARFDAATILADNGVACVIDISDGLCGDAGHIAEASDIAIEWTFSSADVAPELISYCRKYAHDPLAVALSGGEDYELLFACRPDTFKSIRKDLPGAYPVGRCLSSGGRRFVNLPRDVRSFQHGFYQFS